MQTSSLAEMNLLWLGLKCRVDWDLGSCRIRRDENVRLRRSWSSLSATTWA